MIECNMENGPTFHGKMVRVVGTMVWQPGGPGHGRVSAGSFPSCAGSVPGCAGSFPGQLRDSAGSDLWERRPLNAGVVTQTYTFPIHFEKRYQIWKRTFLKK